MSFGHILTFLHFLGHPRLLGTLQAVRTKTFANSILTNYVLGKVMNFHGRPEGPVGPLCPAPPLRVNGPAFPPLPPPELFFYGFP